MSDARNPKSAQRLKRLNNRQRKKQRVGEYRELGFHLVATLAEDLGSEGQDALLDAWLTRVDEAGVSFGGHFDGRSNLEGVVFPVGTVKIGEELRNELAGWLKARSEVKQLEASELIDLWHVA